MATPAQSPRQPHAPPATPIARRVAPDVKLRNNCCLRCSKVLPMEGLECNKTETRKCDRCRRLKKDCQAIPQSFVKVLNSLMRSGERLGADDNATGHDVEAWTQARREYVANVEAFLRKKVKHGITHKPKGDEIQLLQVDAINRLAAAAEGILDVLRSNAGHVPLGAPDAQSDSDVPFFSPLLSAQGEGLVVARDETLGHSASPSPVVPPLRRRKAAPVTPAKRKRAPVKSNRYAMRKRGKAAQEAEEPMMSGANGGDLLPISSSSSEDEDIHDNENSE